MVLRLTELYYAMIKVKARMPVWQPVPISIFQQFGFYHFSWLVLEPNQLQRITSGLGVYKHFFRYIGFYEQFGAIGIHVVLIDDMLFWGGDI